MTDNVAPSNTARSEPRIIAKFVGASELDKGETEYPNG